MATRFWVGSGVWDGSNTANWSTTSGGTTGAAVPTSADTVTFDANSGNCDVDFTYSTACSTLTITTGFVSNLWSSNPAASNAFVNASGNAISITPGAAASFYGINFNAISLTAATTINAKFDTVGFLASTYLVIGYGVSSTATFTLTTNGNFYKDSSNYVNIEVHSGTLSAGTVNMTGLSLTIYQGTYNAGATTVTLFGDLVGFPSFGGNTVTFTLGTSTINASVSIQLGSTAAFGTTIITTGSPQVLNAPAIVICPTVAGTVTLRTITATSSLSIALASGVIFSAGAVTCNGNASISAVAGYTTLPTATITTSFTGSSAIQCTLSIYEVSFTCSTISLTYSGTTIGDFLYYREFSKGAVNVTGAITLTDTNVSATPNIVIEPQAAFSGAPTVMYAALNASVRGSVTFNTARAVTATTITGTVTGVQNANLTLGAITLGGTLSAVVYDNAYVSLTNNSGTTTITSIAQGTGAVSSQVEFAGAGNLSITGAVGCAWFKAGNSGTVTIGGTLTVVNNTYNNYGCVEFVNSSLVTCASITITGTYAGTGQQYFAIVFGDSLLPGGAQVGAVTMSGTLTVGSAGNRGVVNIDSLGAVNFSSTTATHLIGRLGVQNTASLVFGAGSTLTLNDPVSTSSSPIEIQSPTISTVTFRTVTCDYINAGGSQFIINAPNAAVSFGTLTAGATGSKVGFNVTCASLTHTAADVGQYVAVTSGVLSAGAITISTPTPVNSLEIIIISVGGTSTVQSITTSAVTDLTNVYTVSLLGTGGLTISGVTTGPTATVSSILSINRAGATVFSAPISNFTDFLHSQGNITFTGALAVGVTRIFKLTSGYTITPGTSTITISGAYNTTAELDHGGYTLSSIVFSANGISQYLTNSTSAGSLTCLSFSATGGASPRAFLQLGTDVTVTGTRLTIAPNSLINRYLICSDTFGTARTITAATRTINTGADFRDITAASGTPWVLSGVSTGDCGGNTGIAFTAQATRYAVSTGTFTWDNTAAWAATAGGASGVTAPIAQDLVILSSASGSLVLDTNYRKYLGTNIVFNGFTGTLTMTGDCATLGDVDMESFACTTNGSGTLYIQAIANAVFKPFSTSFPLNFNFALLSRNGISIALGGANNLYSTGSLYISCGSFTTDTGTRIANITAVNTIKVGGITLDAYSRNNSTTTNTSLNSSVLIVSAGSISYGGIVNASTHTATAFNIIAVNGTMTATNCTITCTAGDIVFSYGSTISLGSSTVTGNEIVMGTFGVTVGNAIINAQNTTFIARSKFTLNFGASYTSGTELLKLQPVSASTVTVTAQLAGSPTVNKLVVDDINSTNPTTSVLTLSINGSGMSLQNFDSAAMRRSLNIVIISAIRFTGGLNSIFSNKGYTYITGGAINVLGADPLYIPYAYVRSVSVPTGSVVAYGPANLGNNTGSITYPSRLRYIAFVDTGATSFTVPPDYNGMGLFLAVGGGATPSSVLSNEGRGGGGSGGVAYKFTYPINNAYQPLAIGQTVYINAGNYAVAPAPNTVGGNGNSSWVNFTSNAVPTSIAQGALVQGGTSPTSRTGGAGGLVTYADISIIGKAGGSTVSTVKGGSGGSSINFSGGGATTDVNAGGGGGGGTVSAGISSSLSSGNGGAGGDGSVAGGAGGLGGLTPTAGTAGASSTGAGGGGGGTNTDSGLPFINTTAVTRATGVSTLTITLASHGLTNGQQIGVNTVVLKSGSYTRTLNSTTVTVTITSHGLILGQSFYLAVSTGGLVSGTYTVTQVVSSTQFRFTTVASSAVSGSCTLGQAGITTLTAYTVTVVDSSTFTIPSSVSTLLSTGQLTLTYYNNVNAAYLKGANGGAGATNSAQYFIRYYNGVYTPGYFGVGAGGGGGGGAVFRWAEAGSGAPGGIGAGGGGIGGSGTSASQISSLAATSGRGGPGMVMFIYALRANNQSAIQGQ